MTSNEVNKKTWVSQLRKNSITCFFQHLIGKMLWLLLPVIATVLLAQAYYSRNVQYQVKIEAEKDLYLSQLETYNALQMMRSLSDIITFPYKSYVGNPKVYISVDRFGNHLNKNVVKETENIVFVDSTYSVPEFVCKKNLRGDYIRYLTILKSNCMRLEPEACKKCNELLSMISNNPLPDCDSITEKSVIESGWTEKEIQDNYNNLIEELNKSLESKIEMFSK